MKSVKALAEQLNTSVRSVYRMLSDGLEHYDLPGGIKISEDQLQAYLSRLPRPIPQLWTTAQILSKATPAHQAPCIYFLLAGTEIVYVGKTINVTKRLGRHLDDGKQFDAYSVVECSKRDLERLEMAYISAFKPRYNVMGVIREDEPEPA